MSKQVEPPGVSTESIPSQAGAGEGAMATSAPPPFDARFQSISELARGGQGRVLVARDTLLDREVALKELLRSQSGAAVLRFEREARLAARLQHPGIVSIYELARRPSGEPVLVMRRVQGERFDRAIARAGSYERRLALLPAFIAACDAIAYAHQQGVIHRDIKPANVLLGDFGDTVVIDWGLAKQVGAPAGDDPPEPSAQTVSGDLTSAGELLGTPAFMSPEQARGEPAGQRSDVYALGAMLYQLLAGRCPYEAGSAEEMLAEVRKAAPPPIESVMRAVAPELVRWWHGRWLAIRRTATPLRPSWPMS